MQDIKFADIGVNVKDYTPDSIYALFQENGLDSFVESSLLLDRGNAYVGGSYLQSNCSGSLNESTRLFVFSGYIRYVTDMETYLLILRTALLDIDVANELVTDLYYQGLIKPRNIL